MPMSNAFKQALALHLFNNADIANLGDATGVRGSTTPGSLYIALHTADPGAAGNQSTSECNYSGYARVAVARSSAGFTVTNGTPVNAAEILFPTNNSGSSVVITHFSIGLQSSGATTILAYGTVTYTATNGTAPRFQAGQLSAPHS